MLAYNGSGPMAAAYADRVIADAHHYQGTGTVVLAGCAAAAAGTYINPFAGEAWAPSRNDQRVDYDPLKMEPIRAIGAGAIVDIGSSAAMGRGFTTSRPTASSRASASTSPSTSAASSPGTSFNAGDTLATAYPGPDWTEWG